MLDEEDVFIKQRTCVWKWNETNIVVKHENDDEKEEYANNQHLA